MGSRTFTWSFKFRPTGRLIHCELLIIVGSSWTAVNNGELIRWPDAAVEKYLCGTKCANRQNNSSGACCDIDYAAISTFRLGPTRENCSLVDSIICRPFMGGRSQEYERRLVMSQQPCPWTSIRRGGRNPSQLGSTSTKGPIDSRTATKNSSSYLVNICAGDSSRVAPNLITKTGNVEASKVRALEPV